MSVPVYALACMVTLSIAILGDRLGHRGYRGYINLSVIHYLHADIRNTGLLILQGLFWIGFYRVSHTDFISQYGIVVFCCLLGRGVSPQEYILFLYFFD